MVHATSPLPIALEQLNARYATSALTTFVMHVAIAVARWDDQRKFKKDLERVPDYLLEDMGIERPFEPKDLLNIKTDYY